MLHLLICICWFSHIPGMKSLWTLSWCLHFCHCDKHHGQEQPGEERVCVTWQLLSYTALLRKLGRNWEQRPWSTLLTSLLSGSCSASFGKEALESVVLPTMGEASLLPSSINNQEDAPQTCLQASLIVLHLKLFLPRCTLVVSLTIKVMCDGYIFTQCVLQFGGNISFHVFPGYQGCYWDTEIVC